jgi:hypothetical protein
MTLPDVIDRARALLAADTPAAAETLLRPHLASGTGPLPLWRLLAQSLRRQCRLEETLRIQTMLVDTAPGDLSARFDLAETLLLLGQFERGWREYRHRYSLPHTTRIERKVQTPRWNGEKIPGQTLLIHDEQGFGDTFQFIRLLHQTATCSAARLILQINPETFSLAKRAFPDIEIIPRGTLPPAFDVHCELMSLPQALNLQLPDLPGPMPYLRPDPARLAHWQSRLAGLPRPLIALAWAGRPTHPNDANRSMTLAHFAPLAGPATYLAIQQGPAAAQAATPPPGMNLHPLSPEITDFEDTAAILTIADLLISVDSSPTHLAGALGRPAWVLLPFVPDWRWLLNRPDSPWYPNHRLFRQPTTADWLSVMGQVSAALVGWGVEQARPGDRALWPCLLFDPPHQNSADLPHMPPG